MKKDLGEELLKVLDKQRATFSRTADGGKYITNRLLYDLLDKELYRIQILIGKENKKDKSMQPK